MDSDSGEQPVLHTTIRRSISLPTTQFVKDAMKPDNLTDCEPNHWPEAVAAYRVTQSRIMSTDPLVRKGGSRSFSNSDQPVSDR